MKKTIGKTFNSIINQSSHDFEYVVVDGGSTDATLDLVKEFERSKKFKGIFKYISEADQGIYDAINKGIKLSTGSYIGLLNSDDWYEENVIEVISKNISIESDVDIFYGYIRLVKDGREYMVRRNNYDFIMEGIGLIQHPTCFIRKRAYEDVGSYDISYRVCADQDMMLRMYKSNKTYKPVDCVITNFSMGGISYSYDSSLEVLRFKLAHGIISKVEYINRYLYHKLKKIIMG